jgi:hypothetical protein
MEHQTITEKKKRKYIKLAIKISLWLVASLIFLASSLFIAAILLEDKIATYAIDKLNEEMNTSITYKELSFSFIRRFPDASLDFTDVVIKEVVSYENKESLLETKNFLVRFDFWDIITGNYTVRRIEIQNGFIKLKHFSDNTDNYQIFKSDSTEKESGFNYNLNKVIFKNIHFDLIGYKNHEHYSLKINKGEAKGNFSNINYTLKIDGDFLIQKIMYDSSIYIAEKPAKANFVFSVSNKDAYHIKKGELKLNKLDYLVNGDINYFDSLKNFSFNIAGNNLKLHDFIKELPEANQKQLEGITTDGDFNFDVLIKGDFIDNSPLNIELKASMKNGKISKKESNLDLSQLTFNLYYSNGNSMSLKDSRISFSNFSTSHKTGKFQGEFSISNFVSPNIKAKLNGDINLSDLNQFIKNESIAEMSGKAIMDVDLNLSLKSMDGFTPADFVGSQSVGTVNIENARFVLKDNPNIISNLFGLLKFDNTSLMIENSKFNYGISDFEASGSLLDIFPFLMNPDFPLKAKLDVQSQRLDFDDLFKSGEKQQEGNLQMKIPKNISANVSFSGKQLKFGKFDGNQYSANIQFDKGRIDITSASINAMDGNISAKGKISQTNDESFFVTGNLKIRSMNVRKLFYAMNDFGQATDGLTYNKINGIIDSDIEIVSEWNSDFSPKLDRLLVLCDATIKDGEIRNYSTLESMAKYTKISNLSNVKFEKMTNTISIRNEVITIPEMEIKSNASTFKVSGTHSFSNEINYRIEILLSEVLGRQAKESNKSNPEFLIEDDGLGGKTKIHLLITGTTDKPIIKYDTRSARKSVVEEAKTERKEIKRILNEEFGLFKKDTTLNKNASKEREIKQKEKEKIKKQEEGKFIIEWDE